MIGRTGFRSQWSEARMCDQSKQSSSAGQYTFNIVSVPQWQTFVAAPVLPKVVNRVHLPAFSRVPLQQRDTSSVGYSKTIYLPTSILPQTKRALPSLMPSPRRSSGLIQYHSILEQMQHSSYGAT